MSELSILTGVSYAGPGTQNAPRTYLGLSSDAWMRIGVLALLMVGLFWPNLRRLWLKTNPVTGEANWGHAIFVPLIGLYYLYLNRDALLSPATKRASKNARTVGIWIQFEVVVFALIAVVWGYYPVILEGRNLIGLVVSFLMLQGAIAGLLLLTTGRALDSFVEKAINTSSTWFGMFAMLWGLWLYSWGIWPGQNDFFKDCAMVVILFGVVLLMCGWHVMKIAWFPIAFLVCAIPWPGLMYSKIALPLQQVAAAAAIKVLNILGVESYREGTKLIIVNGLKVRVLNVAEACAGLKSLMTFISVGAAVGFLSSRATWQKIVITLSAIPIAIFCNMMRVTGQGILDHYWSEKLSEGFAHQFVGLIMLIPAFFLILLVGWVLDNVFIEEADKRALPAPGSRSKLIEIPRTAGPKPPAAPAAPAASAPQPAKVRPAAPPITASVITQAPITAAPKAAPAAKPAPAPAAKPANVPAPALKPAAQKPAPAPAAPANNDLAAATARLTAASIRRPRPVTPAPQANPPKPTEGK